MSGRQTRGGRHPTDEPELRVRGTEGRDAGLLDRVDAADGLPLDQLESSQVPSGDGRPYAEITPQGLRSTPSGVRTSPLPSGAPRHVRIADVQGDALLAYDIRDGDQLVLVQRPRARHGDLVVLPLSAVRFPFGMQNQHGRGSRPDDPLTLWKVYPEASRLRLSTGPCDDGVLGETSAPVDAPLHGIVVGVLRRPRRDGDQPAERRA